MTELDRVWAENARSRFPHITSYGFGLPSQCQDNWGETLTDEDVSQIIAARDFLTDLPSNLGVNQSSPTSASLRNLLKGFTGIYVYEGAMTLAALALGLPVQTFADHQSRVGVSKQALREYRDVVRYYRRHSSK